MTYAWDNYTRQLVIGWGRHWSPETIYARWPWPTKPSAREIRKVIQHAASVRGGNSVRAGAVVSAAVQSRPELEGER